MPTSGRWDWPNILSLARVPLVAPAVWLLARREYIPLALAFLAAAFLTDVFDGVLARRLGRVTDLGKKIDPLADKVAIAAVGAVLVWKYGVPWWLFAAVVARDVAIVLSAWVIIRRRRLVPASEFWGKAAASAMVVYALAAILSPASAPTLFLMWTVVALLLVSSASYAAVFVVSLRGGGRTGGKG